MKHLKLFENTNQYESYKNGSDYVLPNVSYVYDIGNEFVKTTLIDKHEIWQNESEIRIHNANKDNDLILPLIDYDKKMSGLYKKV